MIQTILATMLFMDGSMKDMDNFQIDYPVPLSQCLVIPVVVTDGYNTDIKTKFVCETTDGKMLTFYHDRGQQLL